jgi:hypothetical protein
MHNPPLASTSPRSPSLRPRPIPAAVRSACQAMVHDGIGFIDAAKANGLKPDTMRRWLHRPEVVGLLRRERAAFRAAVCAANEAVLASIRDEREGNQMARVHAIRTLEGLDAEAGSRQPGAVTPGVTINIIPASPSRELVDVGSFRPALASVLGAQGVTIDARLPRHDAAGQRIDEQGRKVDQDGNPIFQPSKSW